MSGLFKKAIVTKPNVLNEIRNNNMSLQELRFFSIYLSKINPKEINTRAVRFSLYDFQKIMDINKDMNITHFKLVVRKLLQHIIEVPNENGGYTAFQLFKECCLDKDENEEWYVEINAHDNALPLMFNIQGHFFSYQLWNALRLKSVNQFHMYEFLKSNEWKKSCEVTVSELKRILGIGDNEYVRWDNFKKRVLDSCQKAIEETTDINFTYERCKAGKGGKWISIKFHINKNKKYKDPLSLKEFIEIQPTVSMIDIDEEEFDEELYYGSELAGLLGHCSCNDEFNKEQVAILKDLVLQIIETNNIDRCDYLKLKFDEMKCRKPNNKFAYLCQMLKNDIKEKNL